MLSDEIIKAARELTPNLRRRLGPGSRELDRLLDRAAGGEKQIAGKILTVLEADEIALATLEKFIRRARFIKGGGDPNLLREYDPPIGDPDPIPATILICPIQGCPTEYTVHMQGEDPPLCPRDGRQLVKK